MAALGNCCSSPWVNPSPFSSPGSPNALSTLPVQNSPRSHQSPQYYQHLSCHALSNPVRPYCVPLWKGLNLDCPTAACSWWSVAGEGQCPGHLWVSANKTRANARRRTSGPEAPTFQRAFLFRIFFL